MTDEQHAALTAYVRQIADLMGLRDWRVDVKRDEPADDGCYAQVKTIYGQNAAQMRVAPWFFDRRPYAQRETITHELLHIHFAPLERTYAPLARQINPPVYDLMNDAHCYAEELAVDALAQVIAPTMPLPAWEQASAAA